MQMDTKFGSISADKRKHLPFISVEGTTTTIIQTKVRTQLLVSVYSYRWVNGQRIYSIDSDAFVCTPRTLTTVSSTASTLTVKWSKLYGISGYYVYKSTSSNSGYKRYATLSANATSVKVKSLTSSGNTYFYVVPYRVYKGKRYTFPYNIYRMYTRYYYY